MRRSGRDPRPFCLSLHGRSEYLSYHSFKKNGLVICWAVFLLYLLVYISNTMNNLIIKRSQIVEAIINGTPATGVRYYFTDIPNLAANNLRLYGIEGFSSAQLATTPTGYTVVGTTTGIVVTLRDTNKVEFLYQMPFYTTIRANNYGAYTILQPRTINLTDCYVTLTNTSGISASNSVAFNFYYDLV